MTEKWLGNSPAAMIPRLKSLVADLETLRVNECIEPLQAVYIRKIALLPLLKHPRSRHSLWGRPNSLRLF
ncbi:hypothetical protein ABIA24_000923 [Sinorhizobium fredii]